jgi:O-antigen ligase
LGQFLITYFAKKNDPVLLKQTSEKIGEDVKLVLIKDTITPPLDSYTVRKNLMINGYKIAKSHPILGCGPGQFKYNLKKFESKYPIDNNYSPHNYAIELISQFGIIGAVLYLIPFVLLVYLFIILKHRNILFVLSIIYYYILSLIPSSFLYLDINWVFIGIIFIYSVDIINKGTRNLC